MSLSQLPQLYDPLGSVFLTPGIYSEIVMPIVLGRILYGGFLSPWLSERELKPPDSLSKLGKVEVESNPNESR